MAVAMWMDLPAGTDVYDQVNAKADVENNPPEGLIVHVCMPAGGSLKIYDVWESKEAFERFSDERLGPAVAEVMGDQAPQGADGPQPHFQEVHNVIKP